jgi:hypothetical protein
MGKRMEKLNKFLFKEPEIISSVKRYIIIGYLIFPLSFFGINFSDTGVYYDNFAALSLGMFLIAEFKFMSYKYELNKEARNTYIVNTNNMLKAILTSDDSKKNDIEDILEFQNAIYKEDGEVSDNAYFKIDTFDKILKGLEKYIISGIIIITVIWGFGGLFKPDMNPLKTNCITKQNSQ